LAHLGYVWATVFSIDVVATDWYGFPCQWGVHLYRDELLYRFALISFWN
jgi:hypothetical protein